MNRMDLRTSFCRSQIGEDNEQDQIGMQSEKPYPE